MKAGGRRFTLAAFCRTTSLINQITYVISLLKCNIKVIIAHIKKGVRVIRPPASGPHIRPSALGPGPPASYLKFSHYDHGLWVYGLFKPCWLTHATWTYFKETALLFNLHLSCLVNFILCPTDKYMFKVNKLVFGNCGSSIYYQNDQFRKCFLLFDTYVLINKKSIICSSQLKTSCFPILRGKTCFCSTKWCGKRLEANANLPPPPPPLLSP